ncbi:MFS transporter [Sphingobium jiangsuense]|uniref:Putative MFS family arabinose efflux permease n=1 Tax=Sphingobium jiangsuense TaxID=870476 RepID=A0A7W6BF62_9SPHN|nr:MFS transporter [Sphingobium jiangsuense]MBB3925831.1 putative MFS family arabinose efflux permease [Sphingobium jiangsuense]GLT01830.1 MFS transporter [Sphingobium jiangsuense]
MENSQHSEAREFRDHWPVLLGASAAVASGASLFVYAASYFVKPLAAAFGWTRGEIAFGATIASLTVAVAMPVMGMLTDRFGPRRIGTAGLLSYATMCFLLASVTNSLAVFYGLLFLTAVAYAAVTPAVIAPLVAATFHKQRGLALGIMMSGPAMLLALFAPLLVALIGAASWRAGYAALGCLALFLGLPGLLFASRAVGKRLQREQKDKSADGLTLGQAVRTSTYWKLILATIASTLPLGGLVHQYAALLSDKGLVGAQVALMGSLFVVSVVIGRTGVGFLLDSFRPPLVAMAVLICAAAASLLMFDPSPTMLACAVFLFMTGCAMGAEGDFHAFFAARQFGLKGFSAIFGTFSMCTSAGFGFGAYMFGTVYDRFGSYDKAILLSASGLLIGALLFGSLPDGRAAPLPSRRPRRMPAR